MAAEDTRFELDLGHMLQSLPDLNYVSDYAV